jgi:aspartate/methionine/tyrosine aminotransferase
MRELRILFSRISEHTTFPLSWMFANRFVECIPYIPGEISNRYQTPHMNQPRRQLVHDDDDDTTENKQVVVGNQSSKDYNQSHVESSRETNVSQPQQIQKEKVSLLSLALSTSPTDVLRPPSLFQYENDLTAISVTGTRIQCKVSHCDKHCTAPSPTQESNNPGLLAAMEYPAMKSTDIAVPWPIFPMSKKAQRTQNPIRAILDPIMMHSSTNDTTATTAHAKTQISLALGDPIVAAGTTSASLRPCPHAIRAVQAVLEQSDTTTTIAAASYTNAIGTVEGRRAIAKYHSHPYYTYQPDQDIIVANGCSGALEIALTSLLDHHQHDEEPSILLVPSPGFPLYRVIAESHGATVLSYPLLPHQQWEIDLNQLKNILTQHQQRRPGGAKSKGTIRGIVVNNPSNPTGAVYSTHHLEEIIGMCQEYYVPIIADEIYGDLIFPSHLTFVSLAQLAAQMGRIVPIITASGIGKQFLLPGWRVGWICFQDKYVYYLFYLRLLLF